MEVAAQRHKSFWAGRCVGDFYVSPIDQTLSVSSAVVRMGGKACEHVFDEAVAFAGSETHVLVVDDSIVDRKIIERLLKTDTVKVTTVDSPIRALEILRLSQEQTMTPTRKNFSMVITDYCMPEMTGYDLLKKLKEIKGLKEIPVVIMSSENVPQRIQRCLDAGAKEFIMKPVQREDVKKIRRHIIQLQSQSTHAADTTTVSVSTKRKLSSANLAGETNERRPRFSGSVRVP